MPKKSQFKNLVLQQALQEYTQQPTTVQPAITLPIKPEALIPLPPALPFFLQSPPAKPGTEVTLQKTSELLSSPSGALEALPPPIDPPAHSRKKKLLLRGIALLLSTLLVLAIYFTWHSTTPTAASPTITQQTEGGFASTPGTQPTDSTMTTASGNGNTIQVYIVGAVKHPGVYTLPTDARVYQLIQAAGGTQSNADLVSINMAAKLTDGQEIYVLSVGEAPPAYTGNPPTTGSSSTPATSNGSLVNINTATETVMKQSLHVSAATATKIIDYRTQHGPYTSVDQLAQVVSKTIYDRIKGLVTV